MSLAVVKNLELPIQNDSEIYIKCYLLQQSTHKLKQALTAPYGYEETLSSTWPRNMCIYSASLVSASYGKDWHLPQDNSFLTFSDILQLYKRHSE